MCVSRIFFNIFVPLKLPASFLLYVFEYCSGLTFFTFLVLVCKRKISRCFKSRMIGIKLNNFERSLPIFLHIRDFIAKQYHHKYFFILFNNVILHFHKYLLFTVFFFICLHLHAILHPLFHGSLKSFTNVFAMQSMLFPNLLCTVEHLVIVIVIFVLSYPLAVNTKCRHSKVLSSLSKRRRF